MVSSSVVLDVNLTEEDDDDNVNSFLPVKNSASAGASFKTKLERVSSIK